MGWTDGLFVYYFLPLLYKLGVSIESQKQTKKYIWSLYNRIFLNPSSPIFPKY